ncbi:MAG: pyridoxal phosphate-dependent aminotransferase [Patescibacteria group bacterium]|jgi:aspartate aminotransferase
MPLNVSKRTQQLITSPIRKFLPLVVQAEKRGIKVYKINVGDPDIAPPPQFLQTVKKYNKINIRYAPSPGIPEHVQAWIKYYAGFGINLKPQNIVPTVGGAEGIILAMMAVANPGDEIIVFEPLYTSYKGFATMCDVKLVPVTLKVENNFALPSQKEIEKKITKKTKAIVVINPNNPTGTALTDKEIKLVIKIAKIHSLFIISDETYREIVFTGKPTSLLKFSAAKKNLVLVDSASKRFSMPGARIGCIASYNPDIMWSILKLAMIRLSVPTLEQYGLVPILNNSKPYTTKLQREYKKRRDVIFNALTKMPGVECKKPQGAFYIIAKLPVKNAEDFIKFLLNDFNYQGKTVLLTPAAEFYVTRGIGKNEIRIAYVLNTKELKEAMVVLQKALEQYQLSTC